MTRTRVPITIDAGRDDACARPGRIERIWRGHDGADGATGPAKGPARRRSAGHHQSRGWQFMIETVVRRGGFVAIRSKWFSPRPAIADGIGLVRYVQSSWTRPCPGFVRQAFSTKLIDLSQNEEEIFAQFGKNTQYKIRRAEREGVSCGFDVAPKEFADFYNSLAATAGWSRIKAAQIESAGVNRGLTAARDATGPLAMHSYVVDPAQARARLWHSAAIQVQESSSERRNLVGRANRLLHFRDMIHFKQAGLALYDFGGYSTDPNDSKKQAIARFKDGFGGRIVNETNFYSYGLYAGMLLEETLARLNRRQNAAAREEHAA